ncbi:hypothetical protein [Flammeovirga kamogawensis]|uniref:DUF4861 domain-containing protein n=1 Tax=Flammeovirga kamogawensis TaxID=373891 RepID=A0ABX8H3Q2_9BACT|nr:hypothetical protein [Flammeovirga kamogawensis]MBB6461858.1 hypothetical protein [Flammeovirga kamogawensis]QWG10528.1 hypothetical protein KM029_26505 [Flammeovirga kamogawensis]TRX63637.1 hypothetical protein EO216_24780 [Flammeovirga kamogawensis]
MNLHGQNVLQFSIESGEAIKSPIESSVLLKFPDGRISKLYSDSKSKYDFIDKEYFTSKGKYILSIYFIAEKYGQDSIEYDFELNGDEIKTTISVNFDFKERLIEKGNIYEKGEEVLNGYVRINKYYNAPKTIELSIDNENIGTEYYNGPFFKIKNNSTDTLYGEHLPGYFWGTLSYLRNDSTLMTRIGILDYNFIDSPPLYPDSTKITSVGSFGLRNKLVPFDYRFEVLLAKKWQSTGIGIYEEHKSFSWWAGTKEFYKLDLDFKIE